MASIIQSYAGVTTPAFLIVERVSFQVLPQSQIKTLNTPFKSGEYYINKEYGVRTFTADVAIKTSSGQSVMDYADDLAEWLHHEEPMELIFRDKPSITYYAQVDNSIDIQKFGNSGRGQITFVCYDPHGYGAERTFAFSPLNTDPINITNGGNTKAHPVMSMEFAKNVTDFAIMSDNNMLYFGEPFDQSIHTPADLNPRIFNDNMSTLTGWTAGVTVDDGVVAGTLYSTGQTFKQNGSYGTGTKWHGGSLMKSLPREVQDFTVEVLVNMGKATNNMLGRIECYLLDVNLNKIGKIAYQDASSTIYNPTFKAVAGPQATGKVIVNSPEGYLRINKKKAPINVRDIYGWLKLTRKGKKYTASIYAEVNGKRYLLNEVSWTDTKNLYNKKLASIQIHISAHGNSPAIGTMSINHINVFEHLPKPTVDTKDYVFRTGDILTIDNATGEILKNGEAFYEDLYPTSSFISLDKGVNGISVSDPAIINGTIIFKERWL
ncbi:phage tail family protein [Peribacillus frigoritolerans]|nr:phage tail family protein [Peribacillus frigoritolerans]